MKSPASALLLLAFALLPGCSNDETPSGAATPASTASSTSTAPQAIDTDAKFVDLQGQPVELGAYAGKKVFLNYWATWCAPCIREIPSIARASAELEDEGYVFLLASDETLDTIGDVIAEREFDGNFITLNKFFGAWGINAVPSSEL